MQGGLSDEAPRTHSRSPRRRGRHRRGGGPATSSQRSALGFCGVARGVARDIVSSTSISNGRTVPANVKVVYPKVAAVEPALLAAAPGSVKTHLRPVFGFINLVIADFKKVNWNPAELAPYAQTLIARARAVAGDIRTLKVYFRATCKLNV